MNALMKQMAKVEFLISFLPAWQIVEAQRRPSAAARDQHPSREVSNYLRTMLSRRQLQGFVGSALRHCFRSLAGLHARPRVASVHPVSPTHASLDTDRHIVAFLPCPPTSTAP